MIMSEITEINKGQESMIPVYMGRYFSLATSTKATDRDVAEEAGRRLAETVGVEVSEVYWENSPGEACSRFNSLMDSLMDSLRASLWDSLRDSLMDSLRASLWDSLRDSLMDSLRASLWDSLMDSLRDSLRDSLMDSLRDSLRDSLMDSLRDSLMDSLRASLRASLIDSLRASLIDSLRDSLRDSLWDSLWDSSWLAFYTYCVDELPIEIDNDVIEKLKLYNKVASSCFAMWIVPGALIFCEHPSSVDIQGGKLIGMEWSR
jgi:hypothetical protein